MLFGELRPLLRPMSRRLAAAGWAFAALGVVAGLAVAVGSGVRLSPAMQAVQATTTAATIAAGLLLTLAALSQPTPDRSSHTPASGTAADGTAARATDPDSEDSATGTHVKSFLVAAVAMLLGVVGFSLAGWLLPGGPSPQSTAFSQIFLLGAGSCGLTFLLLHKVEPSRTERDPSAREPGR